MILRTKKHLIALTVVGLALVGCSNQANTTLNETPNPNPMREDATETLGQQYTKTLTDTAWIGTRAYDLENNDLSAENAGFLGLALYDMASGHYEFFDKETTLTRGDEGTFFITEDGQKRILISQSNGYQAIVDLTNLTGDVFTYKRMGKAKDGSDVEVFVEHIPYSQTQLTFTNPPLASAPNNDKIDTTTRGIKILGDTLWNGTKVLDENGVDVTQFNQMFISIAKYDASTNKYEFFNVETGVSRGDYGYFDVINNRVRAHVSIGENRYGAVLSLTELNTSRFTYQRGGKDKDGNDIQVFVEHEPYTGTINPQFSF